MTFQFPKFLQTIIYKHPETTSNSTGNAWDY